MCRDVRLSWNLEISAFSFDLHIETRENQKQAKWHTPNTTNEWNKRFQQAKKKNKKKKIVTHSVTQTDNIINGFSFIYFYSKCCFFFRLLFVGVLRTSSTVLCCLVLWIFRVSHSIHFSFSRRLHTICHSAFSSLWLVRRRLFFSDGTIEIVLYFLLVFYVRSWNVNWFHFLCMFFQLLNQLFCCTHVRQTCVRHFQSFFTFDFFFSSDAMCRKCSWPFMRFSENEKKENRFIFDRNLSFWQMHRSKAKNANEITLSWNDFLLILLHLIYLVVDK